MPDPDPPRSPPNLQLSEILQELVDAGALSEGSDEYQLAQKVVREGFEALSPEERTIFRTRFEPRLETPADADAPQPTKAPFPPSDLVSKRHG